MWRGGSGAGTSGERAERLGEVPEEGEFSNNVPGQQEESSRQRWDWYRKGRKKGGTLSVV